MAEYYLKSTYQKSAKAKNLKRKKFHSYGLKFTRICLWIRFVYSCGQTQ